MTVRFLFAFSSLLPCRHCFGHHKTMNHFVTFGSRRSQQVQQAMHVKSYIGVCSGGVCGSDLCRRSYIGVCSGGVCVIDLCRRNYIGVCRGGERVI